MSATAPLALGLGQVVGNYKITAKLGEGGMGVVYLAEHPVIGKKVALKAIHPDLARNPEVVSRFIMEAKAVNQIGHEHIVDIGDFGNTAAGDFYFIMEYLQGESLADRLKREERLSQARALAIAAQIADALSASHDQGIIHRDLKPENIFLITRGGDPDFVKVLDFGLAKLVQVEEKVDHKTRAGLVMGTPYYMSPEQGEGKIAIDHRADIYSLGVLLFEMLTGKVPFGGEGYGEIIVKHVTHQAPSARKINPAVSGAAELIIFRALAKDRDQRFQTMHDFRRALLDPETYLAGTPTMELPAELTNVTRLAAPMARQDMQLDIKTPPPPGTAVVGGAMKVPSTFRHAVGQLERIPSLRPHLNRKMVLGVGGGIAAAALLIALIGRSVHAPERARALSEATANPAAGARHPDMVRINFTSDPDGATVTREHDGTELGLTPLSIEIPYGNSPERFVIRKAGFDTKTLVVVPNLPVPLFASLTATAKGSAEEMARGSLDRSKNRGNRRAGRALTSAELKNGKGDSKSGRRQAPLDGDSPLEPDFN